MAAPAALTLAAQKEVLAKVSRVGQKLVLDLLAHGQLLTDRRAAVEAFSKESKTATVKFEGGDIPMLDLPYAGDEVIGIVRIAFGEGDSTELADRLLAAGKTSIDFASPATWLPSLKNETDTTILLQHLSIHLDVQLFAADFHTAGSHYERRFLVEKLLGEIHELTAMISRKVTPSGGLLRSVELTVMRLYTLKLLDREKTQKKEERPKKSAAVEIEECVLRDRWSLKRAIAETRAKTPGASA